MCLLDWLKNDSVIRNHLRKGLRARCAISTPPERVLTGRPKYNQPHSFVKAFRLFFCGVCRKSGATWRQPQDKRQTLISGRPSCLSCRGGGSFRRHRGQSCTSPPLRAERRAGGLTGHTKFNQRSVLSSEAFLRQQSARLPPAPRQPAGHKSGRPRPGYRGIPRWSSHRDRPAA